MEIYIVITILYNRSASTTILDSRSASSQKLSNRVSFDLETLLLALSPGTDENVIPYRLDCVYNSVFISGKMKAT